MKFTIEPMTMPEIISRAMSVFFSRLGLFLAIEVFMVAPTLILKLAMPELAMGLGAVLFVVPMLILGPIGSAAMLHVIAQEYLGKPVSLGGAFLFALRRFLPLLGTSFLAGIGMMFGFLACCIPGIYLAIIWTFVSQVVVMEDVAGPTALGRSKSLVEGYFWHVFGLLFLIGIIVGMGSGVVGATLGVVLPFQDVQPGNANNPFPVIRLTSYTNFAINQIVATTLAGIGQIFTAVCMTLLYFDLRNRKEAFDVGHIVAWMDQYRNLSDEPMPDWPLTDSTGPADTGIKPTDGPAVPPPETGIQNPNPPRADNPPPPAQ